MTRRSSPQHHSTRAHQNGCERIGNMFPSWHVRGPSHKQNLESNLVLYLGSEENQIIFLLSYCHVPWIAVRDPWKDGHSWGTLSKTVCMVLQANQDSKLTNCINIKTWDPKLYSGIWNNELEWDICQRKTKQNSCSWILKLCFGKVVSFNGCFWAWKVMKTSSKVIT